MLLALDFGGTKLSAASHHPETFARDKLARTYTAAHASASDEIATMLQLADEVLDGRPPTAVGVSFGGPVHGYTGVVIKSDHVVGWDGVALREELEAHFGVRTAVDNDGNVAAVGEHRFGAGRGYADLMYITVSTGVGGGIILGGRLWQGTQGLAGEIGHTVADPSGPLCFCGKRGCVERLASGPFMAQAFAAALQEQGKPLPAEITGKLVAEWAVNGNEVAAAVVRHGAWAIGQAIGDVANLLNLQLFVLGGGVTKSGALWWETVVQTARDTARQEIQFEIKPASHEDDAPLWGAVALAAEIRS